MNEEEYNILKNAFYNQRLSECGEPGKIAYKLAQLEGYAIWIPGFVKWLYENYEIQQKVEHSPKL